MKGGVILFILLIVFQTFEANAQRKKYTRDWTLKDSIPIGFIEEPEEVLNIKSSLNVSNDHMGTYDNRGWYNYQNITMVEYGFELKKIPILLNLGMDNGSLYGSEYHRPIYNIKIDFLGYLNNLKDKVNLNVPVDKLDKELSDQILKDEIKKQVQKEIKGISSDKLDSLQNKMESMKNYESLMNNPKEIENIKQRKALLRESAMGNKIQGLNYDSLSNVQLDFDKQTAQYNQSKKDKDLNQYREQYNEITKNKDKALEIKNNTEKRIQKLKNNFRLADKLSLSRLKLNKFNLGQSSVDNQELVFRSYMLNGINIVVKSPFYFNFLYSLPFQTNLFSNQQVNTMQNNEVNMIGGAIGTNKEKKFSMDIGYYRFKEVEGNFDYPTSRRTNFPIRNNILAINSEAKFKNLQTELKIAKSESNRDPNQNLFDTKDIESIVAIRLINKISLLKTQTNIKLELQNIGLNYYSSANPFIRRGQGGRMDLNQRITKKLQLKSRVSFRTSNDSNRFNQNFNTTTSLRYKLNRNTKFQIRATYFKSNIEFSDFYTNIENQIYNAQWIQKFKTKKIRHYLITTAQYSQTKSEGTAELNNTGQSRTAAVILNYTLLRGKLNLNTNAENAFHIDSNFYANTSGINASYQLNEKSQLGIGVNSIYENSIFRQKGFQINYNTQINKISILANLSWIDDKLLRTSFLSPQLRVNYKIF